MPFDAIVLGSGSARVSSSVMDDSAKKLERLHSPQQ